MNLRQLKQLARQHGIRHYSRLRKYELIELLRRQQVPIPKNSRTTTETFGLSVEKYICDTYNLSYEHHFKYRTISLQPELQEHISRVLRQIHVQRFLGSANGSVDFLLTHGKTLSVKTNTTGYKLCPQTIGQTTKSRFDLYFNLRDVDDKERKRFIIQHISTILKEYYRHLFCCDYLLWIYQDTTSKHHAQLFRASDFMYFPFYKCDFTFSRTLDTWNESSTLKVNGISIGEFQVHANRNCIKFRFHMKNLLKVISTK